MVAWCERPWARETEGLPWHQQHAPRPLKKARLGLLFVPTMLREQAYGVPAGLGAGPEFARHANWHWQGTRSVRQQERAAAARRRGELRGPLGGAFDAAVPSSDGALAASGGNERAVETLSPPPPPLERRAAVGRFLHGRVALSTAGQKCVRADLVLTASRSQGHN